MPRVLAALLVSTLVVGAPTTSFAQRYCRPCPPTPRRYCPPSGHAPAQAVPGQAAPDQAAPAQPAPDRDQPAPVPPVDGSQQTPQQTPQAPSDSQQAQPQQQQPQQAQPTISQSQPTTAATSAQSNAPNSIGDFFGTGGTYFTILGSPYFSPNVAAAGGNVGRQKYAENVSPIPRDRVFVNYSLFHNAPLTAGGSEVNRITPGIEKTFQNGNMSLEFRAPFASTVGSTFDSLGGSDSSQFEWGDLTVFLKALFYNTDEMAFAGGVGMSFPTHDEFLVRDVSTGDVLIKADSSAIHVLPYLAALWTPNEQLFVQTYGQIDTDLNGGDVYVDNGGGAFNAGRIQDQTYLFLDAQLGYWVYQNPCGNVQGIAPMVEFHYSRSLNDADSVSSGGTGVSGGDDDLSLLNAVFGVTMYMHNSVQLTAGYGLPIGGADDQFDGEVRVMLNWLFGGRGNLYSNR